MERAYCLSNSLKDKGIEKVVEKKEKIRDVKSGVHKESIAKIEKGTSATE